MRRIRVKVTGHNLGSHGTYRRQPLKFDATKKLFWPSTYGVVSMTRLGEEATTVAD